MPNPKKLLKKMIIAVFCENANWTNNAKIGVFINSILEKPVIEFAAYNHNNYLSVKKMSEEIKKLMTEDYRWEVTFSSEMKVLKLNEKTISFLNPVNYVNMNNLQELIAK